MTRSTGAEFGAKSAHPCAELFCHNRFSTLHLRLRKRVRRQRTHTPKARLRTPGKANISPDGSLTRPLTASKALPNPLPIVGSDRIHAVFLGFFARRPDESGHYERVGRTFTAKDGNHYRKGDTGAALLAVLHPRPVPRPPCGAEYVNIPLHEPDLKHLRRCVCRCTPFGHVAWTEATAVQLGLAVPLCPTGPRQEQRRGA